MLGSRQTGARPFGVGLAVALVISGCTLEIVGPYEPPPDAWDPSRNTHPQGSEFQELLDRYVHQGLPGVVCFVRTPRGLWNGAAGFAGIERGEPMLPTHRHYAASVTKMYTAAATLLLAEDGAIDLDAALSVYLPESVVGRVPNGHRATVRQVLGHTSGIPDFSGTPAYDLDFLNDPLGSYPPGRLLSYLEGQSPIFAPGAGYFYSNAGYFLLALLMDEVAAGGHAGVITQRILHPLGLDGTCYRNDPSYPRPPGLVNSYRDIGGDGFIVNVSDLMIHDSGVFMGNAGLIGTSADFATFIEALLGGGILNGESLSQMEEWGERSRYGLGLNSLETPYGPGIGHSGGDVGARSEVRHFPDPDATLVLLANGGDSGVTERLFDRLWEDLLPAALGGL